MLERALASVYAQTVLPLAIYLIIDEPENYDLYTFLGAYDARLHVSFTGGGYGGAKARNVGLEQAETEFVFFLDDDDEWFPEKTEKQIALLNQRPDAVGVTCGRVVVDGNKNKLAEVGYSEGEINRRINMENLTGSFSQFGFRRSLASGIRLLNELPSAQDFEFYIRLSRFGKIVAVDENLMYYYRHEGPTITKSIRNKIRAFDIIEARYIGIWSREERIYRRYLKYRLRALGNQGAKRLYYMIYALLWAVYAGDGTRCAKIFLSNGLSRN